MLSIIPCSLILVALAFKFNCDFSESFCFKDSSLGVVMLLAFFLHASAHWWALKFIVPKFGDVKEHEPTKLHYEEVASSVAPSFFNLNPAFCLRSKYFYKHETPCTLLIQGREHVLKKSEASLCHFDDPRPVEKEEYGRWRPG
ncbi:unnamed protein product [Effrenium voratum]|nr:unnamed protein product [Effrenium voratum]